MRLLALTAGCGVAYGWSSVTGNRVMPRAQRFLAKFPDAELTLGAPRTRPVSNQYVTKGGVKVDVAVNGIQEPESTVERLIDALDSRLGNALCRA